MIQSSKGCDGQQQLEQLRNRYSDLLSRFESMKEKLKLKMDQGCISAELYNEIVDGSGLQEHKQHMNECPIQPGIDQIATEEEEHSNQIISQLCPQSEPPVSQSQHEPPSNIQRSEECLNAQIKDQEFQKRVLGVDQQDPEPCSTSFDLIEGGFILEKKALAGRQNVNLLLQMVEFVHPHQLLKTDKQILEMIIRYVCGSDPKIEIIKDDMFCSRKNEIVFGTPYEDYSFAFQDNQWNTQKQLPHIFKQMGAMKKKYVYLLVRPEIVGEHTAKSEYNMWGLEPEQGQQLQQENGQLQCGTETENEYRFKPFDKFFDRSSRQPNRKKSESSGESIQSEPGDVQEVTAAQQEGGEVFYETQTIYGFISAFPMRMFFQDLHRTIQQQIKYAQFDEHQSNDPEQTSEQVGIQRLKKYQMVGKIMQKLIEQRPRISQFPIDCQCVTGVGSIRLSIPNPETFNATEFEFMKQVMQKYHFSKISRLLHVVLGERLVIVEADTRKALNEIMEMIRIMIKPFFWLFAVVYVYSAHFEPFLSSPMPIIIGTVPTLHSQQLQSLNSEECCDFESIKMDKKQTSCREDDLYGKAIRKLLKHSRKQKYRQKQTSLLCGYVSSLTNFISKGVLQQQPTDFHIEFMQTQMVSYYKDIYQLNKK